MATKPGRNALSAERLLPPSPLTATRAPSAVEAQAGLAVTSSCLAASIAVASDGGRSSSSAEPWPRPGADDLVIRCCIPGCGSAAAARWAVVEPTSAPRHPALARPASPCGCHGNHQAAASLRRPCSASARPAAAMATIKQQRHSDAALATATSDPPSARRPLGRRADGRRRRGPRCGSGAVRRPPRGRSRALAARVGASRCQRGLTLDLPESPTLPSWS